MINEDGAIREFCEEEIDEFFCWMADCYPSYLAKFASEYSEEYNAFCKANGYFEEGDPDLKYDDFRDRY